MFTIDYIKSDKSRQDIIRVCESEGIVFDKKVLSPNLILPPLFKYASLSKFSVENLINNQITLTCPTELNDLYDSIMHVDYEKNWLNDLEKMNQLSEIVGIEPPADEGFKFFAREEAKNRSNQMMDYLIKDFYVSCFTTCNSNVLMWSHYAKNSTGFCLEYDPNKINESLRKFIFPIIYVDKPVDVTELLESKNNDDITLSVLISIISKFKDWVYEKELRVILYAPNNKDVRIPVKMPLPDKIYLGNKFFSSYLLEKAKSKVKKENDKDNSANLKNFNDLLDYVEENNIDIFIAQRQRKSFEINFLPTSVQKIRNNEVGFL